MSPLVALLLAAVLFSTGGVAIKATALDGAVVVCLRSLLAAAALLLLLPGARRGWRRETVVAALPYAATLTLFGLSTKLTTAANAIFLQSTAPLWVAALAPWLLGEPLRRRDLLFLAVMLLGLVTIVADPSLPAASAPAPRRGDLLAAASGLTWALTLIGLRRAAAGALPGAVLVAGNLFAALVTLPAALPLAVPAAGDVAVLLYLGVVQVGLAYVCLAHALRHLPAFEVSLLLLLEPALNPLWVWLVLGEQPGPLALAGGALLIAATGWHVRADSRAAAAA
ncbi:MAG: DMT family transporter [bacterium]|nr:DMT family transporter [bacterium]